MIENLLNELPKSVDCILNANLSSYSSFQVGGSCKCLLKCYSSEDLISTTKILSLYHIDYIVIGEGTNLLISDHGIDKVVVRYCSCQRVDISLRNDLITVSGHMNLDNMIYQLINYGFGEIAFLSGIPGTVGGAIAGNAGAFGKQIGDYLISAEVVDLNGNIKLLKNADFNFKYRSSLLKETGDVLIRANLKLEKMNTDEMIIKRDEIIALRNDKHPDWKIEPCAGSIFRNIEPTSSAERRQASGWFLEQAGVKSFTEGGAYVFEHHANIIIAGENASAQNVFRLSERMREAVKNKFNIDLIREIKLIGSF